MRPIICLLACFLGLSHLSQAQTNIDVSGIALFWEVTDTIKAGHQPSPALWERFTTHPGYKQIERNGNRASFLKRVLPIVFDPAKQRQLDSILNGKETIYQYLATHLVKVKNERKALEHYLQNGDYRTNIHLAREAVLAYLPATDVIRNEEKTCFILLFEDNGFGGVNIALDLYNLMTSSKEEQIGFTSHEFHHSLRRKSNYIPFPKDSDFRSLVNTLERVSEEGVASMLDKQVYYDDSYVKRLQERSQERAAEVAEFKELVEQMPSTLAQLDQQLVQLGKEEISPEAAAKNIRQLIPWGGHTMGYYMAFQIEQALGRDNLISVVNSPIHFFLLYQVAALKNEKSYRFSTAAIQLLRSMH